MTVYFQLGPYIFRDHSKIFSKVLLVAHAISFNLFRLDHIEQAEYYTVNYYSIINTLFGLAPAYLIRGSLARFFKLPLMKMAVIRPK